MLFNQTAFCFVVAACCWQTSFAKEQAVVIPEGDVVVGKCVGVHDGDSMTLLIATKEGSRQVKVRLDAIDAPELGQPFSNKSKQSLSAMVFDQECRVESLGGDKYSRTIGRVSANGVDVNAMMLEQGMAWHFAKYDSRKEMAEKHENAKANRAGLWADKDPIPPWEWRKMSKQERVPHKARALEK